MDIASCCDNSGSKVADFVGVAGVAGASPLDWVGKTGRVRAATPG